MTNEARNSKSEPARRDPLAVHSTLSLGKTKNPPLPVSKSQRGVCPANLLRNRTCRRQFPAHEPSLPPFGLCQRYAGQVGHPLPLGGGWGGTLGGSRAQGAIKVRGDLFP